MPVDRFLQIEPQQQQTMYPFGVTAHREGEVRFVRTGGLNSAFWKGIGEMNLSKVDFRQNSVRSCTGRDHEWTACPMTPDGCTPCEFDPRIPCHSYFSQSCTWLSCSGAKIRCRRGFYESLPHLMQDQCHTMLAGVQKGTDSKVKFKYDITPPQVVMTNPVAADVSRL